MEKNQIVLGANTALNIINTQLPFLKAVIPALAGNAGLVGMAVSAAQAILAIIESIPTGGVISVEDQAILRDEVKDIISGKAFEGNEWKQSGFVMPAPKARPADHTALATTKQLIAGIKSGS